MANEEQLRILQWGVDGWNGWRVQACNVFVDLRDYAEAVKLEQRAIREYPGYPVPHRWLAASLGQLDRTDEAREALHQAMAISQASFDFFVRQRPPWFRPEDHDRMLDGLRKAGWQG